MRLDLIDEFRLDLHPYVAGEGTRLFDGALAHSQQSAVSRTVVNGGIWRGLGSSIGSWSWACGASAPWSPPPAEGSAGLLPSHCWPRTVGSVSRRARSRASRRRHARWRTPAVRCTRWLPISVGTTNVTGSSPGRDRRSVG